MKDELTPKQKKFADLIIEGRNGTDAAVEAYGLTNRNSAAVTASRNMRLGKVREYFTDQGYGAATRIVKLSKEAKSEAVRLSANIDILDRIGIGVKKQEVALGEQINFGEDRDEYA